MRTLLFLLLTTAVMNAEVRKLTLGQALDQALQQNPDLTLARIDQQKAELSVRVARDPFTPKIVVGSGAAYSSGYPMSIEGSAPTILQAKTVMSLYNQPQRYLVAQAKENTRTAAIDESAKRDEVAYRTASLYLDVMRLMQNRELARKQIESFRKVADLLQSRVTEGKELPVTAKQAEFNITRAMQRAEILDMDVDYGQATLALTLGYSADDRVQPAEEEIVLTGAPVNEEKAIQSALDSSKDLRRLESQMIARGFEVKSYQSARLPTIDVVAQYGMLTRYNYEDFFRRFQRNNGQLGVSIAWPLLAGSASSASAVRAQADVTRLRTETVSLRDRITVETRKSFQDIHRAQLVRDLAKGDLDLQREQLSVLLSQMQEGRASLRQVEEARALESEKWQAYYDAQHGMERAELTLLRQTGTLMAALGK